jgi:hypothetical protein
MSRIHLAVPADSRMAEEQGEDQEENEEEDEGYSG